MEFLGLGPTSLVILIALVGVGYRIINGTAGKNKPDFNPRIAASTFMVGIVMAIGIAAPVVGAIPEDAEPLIILAVLASQVAAIMGVDTIVSKGQKEIKRKLGVKVP